MKYIFLFILLGITPVCIFSKAANDIDSLESALPKAKSDTLRINIYNSLIYAYTYKDPQHSIDLSREILPLLEKSGTDNKWAYYYNATGIAYYLKGDYIESIEYYLKAYNLYVKNMDTVRTASMLNNIGTIFDKVRNYRKAMSYYTQSLGFYKEMNDPNTLAIVENNIGQTYENMGNLDSALYFHRLSLKIAEKNKLKERLADSHLNIGAILIKKEEYKIALGHLLTAYRLDSDNKNNSGIVETYAALGEAYLGLNNLLAAEKYLKTGLQLSQEQGTRSITSRLYSDLSQYHFKLNDYKSAYHYLYLHQLLSDSIVNSETRKQIENMQLLNDNEKKAQEIGLLTQINDLKDQQLKSQRNYFTLLIVIVLFLIIICILLWIYYEIKSRANKMLSTINARISEQNIELENQSKKLQELSTEKDNMIGVVAHDLKSPLSKIMGLSGLIRHSGNLEKDQIEYFNLIDRVIADANQLIATILDINKFESVEYKPKMEKISLNNVLTDVTNAFTKKAEEKTIMIHLNCEEHVECTTDREMVSRLLDNLLSNAIKFSERNKNIFLTCQRDNGAIKLSIRDEGPGIRKEEMPLLFKKYTRLSARPTAGESSTGLGLAIVDLIVSKLKGKIEVNTEPKEGTEFIISLPNS